MSVEITLQDLLKPLKDVLLKNWSTSLAHVLDDFVNHLHLPTTGLNFTEAAVVIQNSTNFYCKRLDHVFKLVEELTDTVNSVYTHVILGDRLRENCKAADNVSTPKKRRLAKVLESDDLDLLGIVTSDHSIDLNVFRSKNLPLRNIVLNKDVKSTKKPNTAIPLSNSAGVFFGYKEDFRLGGKTWSDGTVNRDFQWSAKTLTFNNNDYSSVPMDVDSAVENGFDHDSHHENSESGLPSSPCSLQNVLKDGEEASPMLSPPPPLKQCRVKLTKVEDWDPVSFNFVFPKNLKRRRVFSLPKDIIEDAKKEVEKMEKRAKRAEKRAAKVLESTQIQAEDSQDTGYVSETTFDATIQEHVQDDVQDAPVTSDAMQHFKMKRRESAQAAAEVAQRVAEWHEKMTPVLQAEERRKKFNVHDYADVILEKFSDGDDSFKPFSEMMAGEPWEEVSRYFLATLCLANTYNIEIRRNTDAPNDFSVRLLSRVRHHKEMDRAVGNLS